MTYRVSRTIQEVERSITKVIKGWEFPDLECLRAFEFDFAQLSSSNGNIKFWLNKFVLELHGFDLLVIAFTYRRVGVSRIAR